MSIDHAGIGQPDESRKGDWLQTFSGRHFWPLDPRPEEVDIRDIAHSLAVQSRFAGHCIAPYSVAQHCVMVSELCEAAGDALWGLLHDASEAYLCDLPRPLKRDPALRFYCEAEDEVMQAVADRFGLPRHGYFNYAFVPDSVKYADAVALRTEARDLMGDPQDWAWPAGLEPLSARIEPWSWQEAEARFLARYEELKRARPAGRGEETRHGGE